MTPKTVMDDQTLPLDPRELENIRLLKDVELGSVLGLLEGCSVRKLKGGEVLIYAGKPNETVYLLLSGRLRVHLKLTMDPIAILEPGEIVGEISVIDGQPTTANVVAGRESRVLVLDKATFWSLTDASSAVAHNLLYMFASRLRQGDSIISTGQEFQREYARYTVLDAVTGLYNRRWFDGMLTQQVGRCKKGGVDLSLLLAGIDYFKRYHSLHGQVSSDRALYTVAWTLRANMRPGELMARYSGDEFVVVLPNTSAVIAKELGDRICNAVAKTKVYRLDRKPLPSVSISIGVAQMTSTDTPISFVSAAAKVLHDAQDLGGNRVVCLQTEKLEESVPPE
ncbi:GGDEF domain-containing protein [Acidobacteria bacterium AH-259-D05]|nr:GGDEF domain-containing protein [Acidobacteria bacterium AH-259-D05]